MTDGHTAEAMISQVRGQNRWRNLVLAALGIVVAIIVVAAIVVVVNVVGTANRRTAGDATAARKAASAAVGQTAALKAETAANTALLQQLQQILMASHTQTDQLLLALINDNRRIHGCMPLTSVAQLSGAPGCRQ